MRERLASLSGLLPCPTLTWLRNYAVGSAVTEWWSPSTPGMVWSPSAVGPKRRKLPPSNCPRAWRSWVSCVCFIPTFRAMEPWKNPITQQPRPSPKPADSAFCQPVVLALRTMCRNWCPPGPRPRS
ncbi:hypothetical protein GBAR_LOCUS10750 [Geodia barretti]|uniref:Uncharacterized protein n=1 Tax=Geodia barretti TaxID=519541 RepID=A0AA35RV74_GEOBA|nr:hypothetical protein GBAR_LOCUS10750 [Geodia barretti]